MIRHGQTVFNSGDRHQGWGPVSLSEKGFAQADSARKCVENIQFDKIFVSDLLRTRQTAERIFPGKYKSGELIFTEDLREIDTGVFYGKTFDEVYPRYGETYVDCRRRMDFSPLGGESSETVVKRAAYFLKKVEQLSTITRQNSLETEKIDRAESDPEAKIEPLTRKIDTEKPSSEKTERAESDPEAKIELLTRKSDAEMPSNGKNELYAKQANRDDEQDCVNEMKIAAVTHGGVIRAAAAWILGFPEDYPFGFVPIKIANCSVSVFKFDETSREWQIELLDYTGKLV